MKIAFINSCLEPGRDGVGDYTQSLAQECIRQGHECCLVALNDRHVSEPTAVQGLDGLRLPTTMPWPERVTAAQKMLADFAPDWVSLQFVPYAFHPKGFVHGLGRRLSPLTSGRRVHVMFHELWLGEAINASRKDRLIGNIQKRLVLQLLKRLQPQVVHTSNCAYVNILQHYGVQAARLPMFGSIPVADDTSDDWLLAELRQAGLDINPANRDAFWLFGFFGALHPVWPPEPLFSQLRQAADEQGRQVVLLSAGNMGGGEELWDGLSGSYGTHFGFLRLGPQPVDKISRYFNGLDFGIATSPLSVIGKSSSVAAMMEHGLPVIVNRNDSEFVVGSSGTMNAEAHLHKLDDDLVNQIAQWRRSLPESRLPEITERFASSLDKLSR